MNLVNLKVTKILQIMSGFFPIHFKDNPNVPGALQLEAMAQMLTVAITTLPGLKGKITNALEHNVKFKREIKPGEKINFKNKSNFLEKGDL